MWRTLRVPHGCAFGRPALAAWDARSQRWSEHADRVASWLVSQNTLMLGQWLEFLRPVGPALVKPLTDLYLHSENPEVRHSAIVVLAEYLRDDLSQVLALNRTAPPTDSLVLTTPLRQHGSRAIELLKDELSQAFPQKASEKDKDALAKQRSNAGLSLCLLGAPGEVRQYLARQDDPRLRTCLVHGLAPAGVDATALVGRLDVERNGSIRMALLWSLGGYDPAVLGKRLCDELAPKLLGIYRTDPDPGVHSSAEWLLRKWHYADQLAKADAELVSRDPAPDRGWYLNSRGHTMAVVRDPVPFQMGSPPRRDPDSRGDEPLHEEAIDRSFAISTKEVSLEQYRRFDPKHWPVARILRASRRRSGTFCWPRRWSTATGLPNRRRSGSGTRNNATSLVKKARPDPRPTGSSGPGTGFPSRPNGNTVVARGRALGGTTATPTSIWAGTLGTPPTAVVFRTPLACSCRTTWGYSTCWATLRSGARNPSPEAPPRSAGEPRAIRRIKFDPPLDTL